jgi:ABC-type Na+ transport system ATPase subunit NatA
MARILAPMLPSVNRARHGEVLMITARNGSRQSTLLLVLATVIRPDGGTAAASPKNFREVTLLLHASRPRLTRRGATVAREQRCILQERTARA